MDIALFAMHIIVIVFNCTGWIWQRTRRFHLWVISLTAFSWFVLGIWYGWGYCFLTDWAWHVKEQLGETDLPDSFVQYFFDVIGLDISPSTSNIITVTAFVLSLVLSVYLNFRHRRSD